MQVRVLSMNRSEGQWEQPELTVPAYRGLSKPFTEDKGTGVHWSTEEPIAKGLAGLSRIAEEVFYKPRTTDVLHADIPFGSVETDNKVRRRLDVLGVDDPREDTEKEVTAKKGSKVLVKSITRYKESPMRDSKTGAEIPYKGRKRTRTFNPPREMKA